jgi:hypothetical protein
VLFASETCFGFSSTVIAVLGAGGLDFPRRPLPLLAVMPRTAATSAARCSLNRLEDSRLSAIVSARTLPLLWTAHSRSGTVGPAAGVRRLPPA